MPSWFLDNKPMDPHHIFAAATATASDLQVASSKAANKARGDIATTIETRFQGLTKQFQEEVGQGPNAKSVSQFTQAYKSVVSQTINGSEVVEREIKQEDGDYRAYVLMRMPIGEAQEQLMQKIQTQRNTFTRFRSSQAFKELEKEVDGYRQRQKEQQAREQGRASAQIEEQGTGDDVNAQVQERQAEGSASPSPSDAPTEEQVQAGEEETEEASDAEVTERDVEGPETQNPSDAPTEDQVQAPESEDETEADQPNQEDASLSRAERIERRVRSAAQPWMGTRYKLGGESKNGVDCSALVRAVYDDAFSIDLPRTTGQQVNRGQKITRSQMRAGDLVFFRTGDQAKHVGIYLDNRKFVHASSSQGVTISPLKYDYWQENYWQTRRLSVL